MSGRRALAAAFAVVFATVAVLAGAAPGLGLEKRGDDWEHAKLVIRRLAAHPPDGPVVYLLGGSSARECTVDDAEWSAQIARKGVAGVRARNLGASSQTYAQGMWLVGKAPDVPTLVLIGVNVGRYTPPFRPVPETVARTSGPVAVAAGAPAAAGRAYDQHRFHHTTRTLAEKRALVVKWVRERYPVFKERYADHAGVLPQLVAACLERGFRPVIVELPLDEPVVGDAWDAARQRYQAACGAVAATYHVPYVDFVSDIGLASSDFYDLTHLIEPGRVKWQERLSRLVVKRLRQYHLVTSSGKENASDNG